MIDPWLDSVRPYKINTMPDSSWLDLLNHGYGYFADLYRDLPATTGSNDTFINSLEGDQKRMYDEIFSKSVELAKNYEKSIGGFMARIPMIKKIIFSGPCTIILWADGTKTMARCSEDDIPKYSPEVGFAMAFMKKIFTRSGFKSIIREKGVMDSK